MRCRRHRKVMYATRELAELVLAGAAKDLERHLRPHVIPIRAYLASCGFWHLTSKEQ